MTDAERAANAIAKSRRLPDQLADVRRSGAALRMLAETLRLAREVARPT